MEFIGIILGVFLFSAMCFGSTESVADTSEVRMKTDWLAVGSQWRFEKESSGQRSDIPQTINLSGGFVGVTWGGALEVSRFAQKTGSPAVEITREHLELLATLRYRPIGEEINAWDPYVLAGAGLFRESVHTRFLSTTNDATGGTETLFALGTGVWNRIHDQLWAGLEFRLVYSAVFNPQRPLGEIAARLGIGF